MQRSLRDCELLAPAGDKEALEAALFYGADAVYLGGPRLQLRAARAGFGEEELIQAVARIHERRKRRTSRSTAMPITRRSMRSLRMRVF